MQKLFSDRHGHHNPGREITIREDAPEELRFAVISLTKTAGMSPTAMRNIICDVLLIPPDSNNWSEYPNIWNEVNLLIRECPWFKVYDIAEAFYTKFDNAKPEHAREFAERLNHFFRENGVGWEMKGGRVTYRGSEAFADSTKEAARVLSESGRSRAANEIHEALRDISRRPEPDITGAIQHAIAALESTARDVTGEANRTLGQLIPQLDLPRPLDMAIDKLWGYASDRARHIREGQVVDTSEAELVVGVACAVCTFLSKRRP